MSVRREAGKPKESLGTMVLKKCTVYLAAGCQLWRATEAFLGLTEEPPTQLITQVDLRHIEKHSNQMYVTLSYKCIFTA